jgi:hypothetical protein
VSEAQTIPAPAAAPISQAEQTAIYKMAFDNLETKVHAQVFFRKLASLGIQVDNEQDAADLLMMGRQLRAVHEPENRPYQKISQHVGKVLRQAGIVTDYEKSAVANERANWSAVAADLMRDPELYTSVVILKQAEAAMSGAA